MPATRTARFAPVLIAALAPASVSAASNSWILPVSGDWGDAANWSLGAAPNNGLPLGTTYDVTLAGNVPYTATITS